MTSLPNPFVADTQNVKSRLDLYLKELLRWNTGRNLTGFNTRALLQEKAVAPTWAVVDEKLPNTALDLGSGGGIPAYPLSCLNPDIQWTLVERSKKKGLFLQQTAKLFDWPLTLIPENWQKTLAVLESFPLITCRALALSEPFFAWAAQQGLSANGKLWIWSAGDRLDDYRKWGGNHLGPPTRTIPFSEIGDLNFLEFTKKN